MQKFLKTLAVILCLVMSHACLPAEDELKPQREQFLQARKALREWRMDDFERISAELRDYPLYSYLEFEKLRQRIKQADAREVAAFIKRYQGQPVSWRMRQSWLYELTRRKDWALFLEEFQGTQPDKLQCYKLQAEIKTGPSKTFTEDAIKLWLVGKSQEDACDPVFKYLYDNGQITPELLWQRIRLAMKDHNTGLTAYLARRLSPEDRAWVDLWIDAHRLPAKTLQSPRLESDTAIARDIILHALQRIAARDAMQAHIKWESIKPRYQFSATQAGQLERDIAMQANWQKLPEALEWLVAVPATAANSSVREWRVRIAIRNRDWEAVLEQVEALPTAEAASEEWRYWKATALEKTGRQQEASDSFNALAEQRDYHGFLAADRLNKPYMTHHEPLDYNPAIVLQIGSRDGFIRARELYRAKLYSDARREWASAISRLSPDELKAASALAQQWGWHDRAILTVAKTRDYSDLHLRFPIDHVETVSRTASSRQLDPGHIFAVIRQESAFGETARSSAGARGLMQLMPKTGMDTARKYHIPLSDTSQLYEPEKNILIGTAYLGDVMKQYDGNIVLASAAYNAGPHNVQRWLPQQQKQSPDNWIATITYKETRNYIQGILAYMAIYDWRMDRAITPLKKHMPDIYPESHYPKIEP
jgi:soluble lytic murein transglycosylase